LPLVYGTHLGLSVKSLADQPPSRAAQNGPARQWQAPGQGRRVLDGQGEPEGPGLGAIPSRVTDGLCCPHRLRLVRSGEPDTQERTSEVALVYSEPRAERLRGFRFSTAFSVSPRASAEARTSAPVRPETLGLSPPAAEVVNGTIAAGVPGATLFGTRGQAAGPVAKRAVLTRCVKVSFHFTSQQGPEDLASASSMTYTVTKSLRERQCQKRGLDTATRYSQSPAGKAAREGIRKND